MLQSYFLITRQNSPVAAGEYKVKQALSHFVSASDRPKNMLASSSRVLNVTVHRLIWHNIGSPSESLRVELNIQAQVQDCYQ